MTCDVGELAREARCFSCLSEKDLKQVSAYLLCQILLNGGGGGSSCLLCGSSNPTETPSCTCAIYYNTTLSSLWYWDNGASVWVALIQ
jgi:hypothetical protein